MRSLRLLATLTLAFSTALALDACGSDSDGGGPTGSGGAGASTGTGGNAAGNGGAGGNSGGAGGTALVECTANGTGHDGKNPSRQLFWGEMHLHTAYSLDAFSFGTRTTPTDAYFFAKGNSIQIATGTPPGSEGPVISLSRPLDFAALTDHSEFLSIIQGCVVDNGSGYYGTQTCQDIRSVVPGIQSTIFNQMGPIYLQLCGPNGDPAACAAQQMDAWAQIQADAAAANDPCHFTSFIAYEWSALILPSGATNHRNVIFANEHVPVAPADAVHFLAPPDLWTQLDATCTGACDVVTIPHNSNMSEGESLKIWDPTPAGIAQQVKYQVSAEIYQHKGASECRYDPATGYNEAECQFEQIDIAASGFTSNEHAFVRTQLAEGLRSALANAGNPNPLKLGFVAATDGHNGAPGNVDEDAWKGHTGVRDDTPNRRLNDRIDWGPGGITGVWAEENTRASIFAAIKRRETYGTSGPRIQLRIFQTTDTAACASAQYPDNIALTATPMGGTFRPAQLGGAAAPTFVVEAWPDSAPQAVTSGAVPAVAPLAAVQIIKVHGRWDAGSNQAIITEDPVLSLPMGSGTNFSPSGDCMMVTDPNFDASEMAFYYVRVLQEPTWRWTHHDCEVLVGTPAYTALGCAAGGAVYDQSVQERAWSSPIWYEP